MRAWQAWRTIQDIEKGGKYMRAHHTCAARVPPPSDIRGAHAGLADRYLMQQIEMLVRYVASVDAFREASIAERQKSIVEHVAHY